MKSDRPSIVQYWHEDVRPEHVVEALASVREHNSQARQRVFDQSAAREFIADHYGAREATAFDACAAPAMQADYFRYCAINALGGIYCDANFHCRGSLGRLLGRYTDGVLFGRQDPVPELLKRMYRWPYPVGPFRAVSNGLFGFDRSGHPLLELAIEVATANVENRIEAGQVSVWLATGPAIFTSMYLLRELGSTDSFMGYSAGTVLEPSASLFCDVVGDYGRVERAFAGVTVLPEKERDRLVFKSRRPPGVKSWHVTESGIYR
jgi:mannosyltransferase OCH1-like enzyme